MDTTGTKYSNFKNGRRGKRRYLFGTLQAFAGSPKFANHLNVLYNTSSAQREIK
tara:strand:- start:958 stop:1119 length:162 start_codon:yes stop_codon:yes gene_type:complete